MPSVVQPSDPRYPIGRFTAPDPITPEDRAYAVLSLAEMPEQLREALRGLFESVRLLTETYASVQDFLASAPSNRPCCIVVDIRLPGQSGLEFQEILAKQSDARPIVLISGHVDVQMAVRAMKAGAVDVLTKPVREQDLLEAVNRAIATDRRHRGDGSVRREVQHLLGDAWIGGA